MSFHGPLRDREPQSRSARFTPSRLVHAIESVKHLRLIFGRNSRALVLDLDHNPVAIAIADAHGNSWANRRILHSVMFDIAQSLPKKNAVTFDLCAFVSFK